MTREEMLDEIDDFRSKNGYSILIYGCGPTWVCGFNQAKGRGGNPIAAYLDAKKKAIGEEKLPEPVVVKPAPKKKAIKKKRKVKNAVRKKR
jgi:hypothetical protein